MEAQYLRDLENCTEIVLNAKRRVRRGSVRPNAQRSGGSSSRAAASALRLAHSVGAALGNRRVLGRIETTVLPWLVVPIFLFALVGVIWPRVLAWPLSVFAAWIGIVLLGRYLRSRRKRAAAAAPALSGADSTPPQESRS
jgi:cardiolipin synthase